MFCLKPEGDTKVKQYLFPNQKVTPALLVILFLATAATPAVRQLQGAINYPDFSDTTGLQLNGDAAQAGSALRLAPAANTKVGSAFATAKQDISAFSTTFRFKISNAFGAGADGFTFTIQSMGVTALGSAGGNLGYTGISPSVAIEFDTYYNGYFGDPNDNHIGINLNGNITSVATDNVTGSQLDAGHLWEAVIQYDGTTLTATATNLEGSGSASVSYDVDIPTILGTSEAYVGFTAGTGNSAADHDVLSWQFSSANQAVPEPNSYLIWLLGFLGLWRHCKWRKSSLFRTVA